MPFLHLVKKGGVIVWNFFCKFWWKSQKTIAREGIVMGFKKLTAKKRKKKTTRLPAKRGKSSFCANKL